MDQLEEFYKNLTDKELNYLIDRHNESVDRVYMIADAIVAEKDKYKPARRIKKLRDYALASRTDILLLQKEIYTRTKEKYDKELARL